MRSFFPIVKTEFLDQHFQILQEKWTWPNNFLNAQFYLESFLNSNAHYVSDVSKKNKSHFQLKFFCVCK